MIQSRNRIFTFDDFVSEERRKYLVVVIYDIIDNNRRARFAKYLLGFGERVQKSAFECILTSAKYDVLLSGIPQYITKEDFVRVYKLAGNTDIKIWGNIPLMEDEEVIII